MFLMKGQRHQVPPNTMGMGLSWKVTKIGNLAFANRPFSHILVGPLIGAFNKWVLKASLYEEPMGEKLKTLDLPGEEQLVTI